MEYKRTIREFLFKMPIPHNLVINSGKNQQTVIRPSPRYGTNQTIESSTSGEMTYIQNKYIIHDDSSSKQG